MFTNKQNIHFNPSGPYISTWCTMLLFSQMGTEKDGSDNESSPFDLSNHRCQHGPHDHDHDHPGQEFESSLFRQERRLIAAGRPGGSGFHNFFGFPVQSASRVC